MIGREASLTVVVVVDHDLVRDAVGEVLRDDSRFEVVGVVGVLEHAVAAIARARPSLVLLGVGMASDQAARVARGVREVSPTTRVIVLSSQDDRASVTEMIRSGVVSYLVMGEATNEDVVRTLLEVGAGRFSLPETIGQQVFDELVVHLEHAHAAESRRRALVARVRRVLHGDRLEMLFQPIFGLDAGDRRGIEALARFHALPQQGPARWFADAGEVGLGVELEMLAVRSALPAMAALGDDDSYLALNVSPATAMDASFQAAVLESAPRRVVLEVTEHAALEDHGEFQRAIRQLRAAGVRLAIDDAGAGVASLRHIVQLAPDMLKLDVSLTRDIDLRRTSRAMAGALISFAAATGATVVAEGIERRSELEVLRHMGVQAGQGYLLAPPSRLEQVPRTWSPAA